MEKLHYPQPLWWSVLMLLLAVAYLIPETIFNSQLVNAAGGLEGQKEYLHQVELFGRWISGVGASLLIADLLIRGSLLQSKVRTLAVLFVVFLIVWPIVFFGQKVLVEKLLIEPSTAAERQQAYFSQLLRSGLARNAVNIEGIPYDPKKSLEPPERVFLSLFSGLVYADHDLMSVLDGQKESIVSRYIKKRIYDDFDSYYEDFKSLRTTMRNNYKAYAKGSKEFNAGLAKSSSIADEQWRKVNSYILEGWEKYTDAKKSFSARARAKADEIAPKLYKFFDSKMDCKTKHCIQRHDSRYNNEVRRYGFGNVPQSTWSTEQEGDDAGGFLQCMTKKCHYRKKLSLFSDKESVVATDHPGHYRIIILKLMQPEFEKKTGYTMGIKSIDEFRTHTVTASKIRQRMMGNGVNLPKDWKISDRKTFNQKIHDKVRKDTLAEWHLSMRKYGIELPPNLSWQQFQLHNSTQSIIRAKMGEDYYVRGIQVDWNNVQFKDRVVEPNIRRLTKETLGYLEAQQEQYEDGGPLEHQGKDALRSTLVPPISMVLSLILVLLTIIKIPRKVWILARNFDNYRSQQPWAVSRKENMAKNSVLATTMLVLFAIPLTTFSNPYTQENGTVNYFLEKINEYSSPVFSLALEWALLTQPRVYPVGKALEDKVGMIPMIITNPHKIKTIDDKIVALFVGGKSNDDNIHNLPEKLPLVIKTNVQNPSIKVMNIAPRYFSGIMLKSNKSYDIQVSKTGYVTQRRWVKLNKPNQAISFELTKQ